MPDGTEEKLDYDTTIPTDVAETARVFANAHRAYIERMKSASAGADAPGNLEPYIVIAQRGHSMALSIRSIWLRY